MLEKTKTRSEQEWLELIQECRASGLPDREWCQLHAISIKTFRNKVSDLKKKSYTIPEPQAAPPMQSHEVVPLALDSATVFAADSAAGCMPKVPASYAAVTVRMSGYSVEITNSASEDTIQGTLLALARLC